MYNYLIYTDGFNEIEEMFFKDIETAPNVALISKNHCYRSKVLQKIFRIHYSFQINNRVRIPLKSLWYRSLDRHFGNNNENIYIFSPSWYYPGYFTYLRERHPNCKIAFHFGDTVISKKRSIKNLDIDYLKSEMDYVGSYNPEDIETYQIDYLPMCYSKISSISDLPKHSVHDVVFIGGARNRMNQIQKCYQYLKKRGFDVFFYVIDNRMECAINETFIVTDKIMSYYDYLSYVVNAKAILEILDTESEGSTLRFWDAVMYNKILITNNKAVTKSKYYDKGGIFYLQDFSEKSFSEITLTSSPEYNYGGENSPQSFIEHIVVKTQEHKD